MASPPQMAKHPLTCEDLPHLGTKWQFVGIDLAPNEGLETGVAVLDRDRTLVRMDKIYTDEDILHFLASLGPAENLIVALDVPKSLSISGRWRQEEIKMHPLRLYRKETDELTNRYAQRATDLYEAISKTGVLLFLYFNHTAKNRYEIMIPYRTRTPQGCRALQSLIKTRLKITNMPTNLAPSSVLDAMIGSYAAWTIFRGKLHQHFELFADAEDHRYLEPVKRLP